MNESCTILYRTHGGENKAPRPYWYTKELCLKSILLAKKLLDSECKTNFVIIHDGSMADNPEWSNTLNRLINDRGVIVEKPKKGNSISCLETIHEAASLPSNEVVFIAEDDYLWLSTSLLATYHALTILPTDYITAYDHPVRYQPDYLLGADYPHWYNTIHIANGYHWRTQESAPMTFGAKSGTFRDDVEYFERYSDNGKGSPADRKLFRHLQSLGVYKDIGKKRVLMGPMPSLNTHVHLPWLAPNVNWEKEAEVVKNAAI